jgi:hypothetical protein
MRTKVCVALNLTRDTAESGDQIILPAAAIALSADE